MEPQENEQHPDDGFWKRVRPQDGSGWLYWIVGILLAVLILGGICLYGPAMFAGAA